MRSQMTWNLKVRSKGSFDWTTGEMGKCGEVVYVSTRTCVWVYMVYVRAWVCRSVFVWV